jgi:uncharacterized membrane protein
MTTQSADTTPLVEPPAASGLAPALDRNIRALQEKEEEQQEQASLQERVADAITRFTGSMLSVYLHLLLFGAWIVINIGWTPLQPWDESLVILAMMASVEAIFLSTFVLISQNRMAENTERRSKLDLQTNLLAEHEVTRLITIAAAIADKLGVSTPADAELDQLERDVAPERVWDAIEEKEDKGVN